MSRGWYLMHRGWMESTDFRKEAFSEPQAFLWSIEQAAFEPHRQWFNGTQYEVGRGEFITSLHAMMAAFGWSEKRVRGFRDRMVRAQKWAKRGANVGAKAPTVLTVCNYALFQSPPKSEGEVSGNAEGERRAKLGRSEGEEQKEGINNSNEIQGKESESRALVPALPYADALEAWTQVAAVKQWKPAKPQLTEARRRQLGVILKTHGLDGWRGALARAASSELLGGPDPPGWFNFAFVIRADKFLNILEGNYDRSFTSTPAPQRQSAWLAARNELNGAGV